MHESRDNIFADASRVAAPFAFDADVARVFPDMISRSVPGYGTVIAMSGVLAARYATPGSSLYDLGCSLGASALAMRSNVRSPGCRIIAVDNSQAMIERCRVLIDDAADTGEAPDRPTLELRLADIQDIEIVDASMVVLNFTLQFIPPAERPALLRSIHAGLRPGGILVLSEKIAFADAHLNALNIELYHDFKRGNGYSDLEIARKRSALENVLIPETLDVHRARLRDAGFASCDVWFQCFNFASLIALK